jgi:subtilase family serine protease
VAIVQVLSLAQPVIAAAASGGLAFKAQGSPLTFRILPRALPQTAPGLRPLPSKTRDPIAIPAPREATLQTLAVKVGAGSPGGGRADVKDLPARAEAVAAQPFSGDAGGQETKAPPAAAALTMDAPPQARAPEPAPKQRIEDVLQVTGNSPVHFDAQSEAAVKKGDVVRDAQVVTLPVQFAPSEKKAPGKDALEIRPEDVSGGGLVQTSRKATIEGNPTKVGEATDLAAPKDDEIAESEGDPTAQTPLAVKRLPSMEKSPLKPLVPLGGAQRTGRVERQGAGASGSGGGLPDLTVELKVTPATVKPGEPITLTGTVKNIGGGGSQDTTVNFFLSDNSEQLGRTIDADSVSALPGGGENPAYSREFAAPDRAGKYYLAACVQNVSTEQTLDNNTKVIPFDVVEGKPDLAVKASLEGDVVTYGEPLTVSFSVENLGDHPADASQLRLGLSRTEDCKDVRPLDPTEASIEVPTLGVFESTSESLRVVRFTRKLEPGRYWVCAAVDAVSRETELANNKTSLAFELRRPPSPDLLAQIKLSAKEIEACQNVTADVFITNVGSGESSAVEGRFIRAPGRDLANRDVLGKFPIPALAPGQSIGKRFPVNIPCGTPPQNIHLGVIADRAIDEENVDNNREAAHLCILQEGQPDLKATVLDVSPGEVRQGEEFSCRIQIENIGKKPAPGTRYKVYMAHTADRSITTQIAANGLAELKPGDLVSTLADKPLRVKIPNGYALGKYEVVLEVTPVPAEKTPRDLTANNSDRKPLEVKEQTRPDLAVTIAMSARKVKAGGTETASLKVTNLGNREAARSRLSVLLARAATDPGALIKEIETPPLPKGASFPLTCAVAIRGDAPLGGYHVVALVDAVPAEVNLANNRAHDCLDVIEADQPELEVALTPATGKTCPGGEAHTVQVVTRNVGKGNSRATTGRIIAGREKDLRDGRQMWSGPIPALTVGGAAPGPCHMKFLANAEPGTYYIAFAVDPVAGEKNVANNRAQATLDVCDPGIPDLAALLTLSKNTIKVEEVVEGQAEIRNVGNSNAAASKAQLVLHTSPTLAAGQGASLTSFDVPALEVRKSTGKIPFRLQLGKTKPGTYYLHLLVEPVGRELNIANNRSFRSISVVEPLPPDLIAKIAIAPREQRSGLRVRAKLRIDNGGPSPAPETTCELVLARKETLADAVVLHRDSVPALGPGGFQQKEVDFTVPADAHPSVYTVGLRVTAVPRETRLTNNVARTPLVVVAPPNPDLAARITLNELTVLQGGKITGRARITNIAKEAGAPATEYRIKASRDLAGSDARDMTGKDNKVPPLKAGESVEFPIEVAIDALQAPGTYCLHLIVEGVPKEETLVNNRDVASFLVEAAPPPDILAVLKLSRDKAYPGDTITATMTARNVGQGIAGATTGRLVLATKEDLSDGRNVLSEPIKIPVLGLNEGREYAHSFRVEPGTPPAALVVSWIIERVPRELELANNRDWKPLGVEEIPRADLVAKVTSLAPDPVGRGESVTILLEIANAGKTATSATKARLLAAGTPDFAGAVVLEQGVDVPALEPGFVAGAARAYQVTAAAKELGLIYVRLEADKVPEEDRIENNKDDGRVRYELHEYNLRVDFTGPPERQGANLAATVRVFNEGPFVSLPGTLKVALSPAAAENKQDIASPGAGEREIASHPLPPMKPGESRQFPVTDGDFASFRSIVARIDPGPLDTNARDDYDAQRIPGHARLAVHPDPLVLINGICKGLRELELSICNTGDTELLVDKIGKEKGSDWFQVGRDRLDAIAAGGCTTVKVDLVQQALPADGGSDAIVFASNDPHRKEHKVPVNGKQSGEITIKPGDKFVCAPGTIEVFTGTCRPIAGFQLAMLHRSADGQETRMDAYQDSVWKAQRGAIEKNATYCAPQDEGDDKIELEKTHCNGQKLLASLVIKVKKPVKEAPKCYKVTGRVHTRENAGVPGVAIDGLPGGTVLTRADGTYDVPCVVEGEYTVVASLKDRKVVPPRRIVRVKGADERIEPFTVVPSDEAAVGRPRCAGKYIVKGKLKDDQGQPAHGYKVRFTVVKASGEEIPSDEILTDRAQGGKFRCALERPDLVCKGDKIRMKLRTPEGADVACDPDEWPAREGVDEDDADLVVAGGAVTYNLPCAGMHIITVPVLIADKKEPGRFRSPNAYDLWEKLGFTAIIRTNWLESQKRMVFESAVPIMVSARGRGNNGVGNGIDPQRPGNPPVNDGAGTGPGNPGARGGAPSAGARDPGEPEWQPLNLKTFLLQPGEAYIVMVPCPVKARFEGKAVSGPVKLKLRKGLNLVGFPSSLVGRRDARDLVRHTRSKVLLRTRCGDTANPFERSAPTPDKRGPKIESGAGYLINSDDDHECDMAGLERKDD